jgi:hypothetical protein
LGLGKLILPQEKIIDVFLSFYNKQKCCKERKKQNKNKNDLIKSVME